MKKLVFLLFLLSVSSVFGQSIQSISPTSGTQGQLLTVAITGQNTTFQQGTNMIQLIQSSTGAAISPTSVSFVSTTLIQATFAFSPTHPAGVYDVVISNYINPSTLTLANSFTLNSNPNPPSLSSISPVTTTQGNSVTIALFAKHAHFTSCSNSVSMQGQNYILNPTLVTVIDDSTIQANFNFSYAVPAGAYSVDVSNSLDGYLLLNNAFTLNAGAKSPGLRSISPNSGMQGQILSVSISGQNTVFQQGTNSIQLVSGTTYIYPAYSNVVNDSLINASFPLSMNDPTGLYNVVLANYLGSSTLTMPNGFTLNSNPKPPSLLSISPASAAQGNTLTVTINGQNTHFTSVTNTVSMLCKSYRLDPTFVQVINDSTIQADFSFTYAVPPGLSSIHILNSLDGNLLLSNVFTLNAGSKPVSLRSITPNSGMQGQLLSVSISGQNTVFQQGTNSIQLVQGGAFIYPTSFTVVNDSLINASFSPSISNPTGLYNVVLGNYLASSTLTLPNAFTLNAGHTCAANYNLRPDSSQPGNYIAVNLSYGKGGIVHLDWNWGDGTTDDTTQAPVHTYASPGLRTICLTIKDSAGCQSTFCDTLSTSRLAYWAATTKHTTIRVIRKPNGIIEQNVLTACNLFPNPSNGEVNLTYTLTEQTTTRVVMTDLCGREILQLKAAGLQTPGLYQLQINGSALARGTYLIQISANGKQATKRLILTQ